RQSLLQQVAKRLAGGQALPQLNRLRAQLIVAERRNRRLEGVDLADEWAQTFQFAFVLCADDLGEQCLEHLKRGYQAQEYPTIVADGSALRPCQHASASA